MKYYATILIIALTSFALGWCANGYRIYSSMFNYTQDRSVASANDLLKGMKQ